MTPPQMNLTSIASTFPGTALAPKRSSWPGSILAWRIELGVFVALLILLNLSLFSGGFDTRFIFLGEPVAHGEWWRLFTHPFVHVSLYHLLLDATAFFILYTELAGKRRWERLVFLLTSGAGSLIASLCASSLIETRGLCGLSGVAHGLAAVSALEMMAGAKSRGLFGLGLLSLVLVVGKSVVEAVTGQIAFASWHLGSMGVPIAVCHAGGVLGALLAWIAVHALTVNRESTAKLVPARDIGYACERVSRSRRQPHFEMRPH